LLTKTLTRLGMALEAACGYGKLRVLGFDELIVNHVQALAVVFEELMAFEKFKPGPEDELRS